MYSSIFLTLPTRFYVIFSRNQMNYLMMFQNTTTQCDRFQINLHKILAVDIVFIIHDIGQTHSTAEMHVHVHIYLYYVIETSYDIELQYQCKFYDECMLLSVNVAIEDFVRNHAQAIILVLV